MKENLKKILHNAQKKYLPHASLFEGDNLETMLQIALDLTKNLLCSKDEKPCGICNNCLKIEKNIHPDIKIITPQGDKVKSIKIEEIRQLRTESYILPNEGSHKIFIIENSELMTLQAQNAFIKILEEPPKNVIFILTCESSCSLLKTIISRVQIFKLNPSEEKNTEITELATKFVNAKTDFEILVEIAKIPNERAYLRKVAEEIIEILIKNYPDEDETIKKIDKLKEIIKLTDKNINFNLLSCQIAIAMAKQ